MDNAKSNPVDNLGQEVKVEIAPQSPPPNILDMADEKHRTLKADLDRFEELTKRNEAVAARMLLAGRAEAGIPIKNQEEIKSEEDDKKVADILKRYR